MADAVADGRVPVPRKVISTMMTFRGRRVLVVLDAPFRRRSLVKLTPLGQACCPARSVPLGITSMVCSSFGGERSPVIVMMLQAVWWLR